MADIADDDDKQFDAGFAEGSPPPETAVEITAKPPVEVPPKVGPKPAAEVVAAKVEPEAPKYVQITQEQFDGLQAAASKTVTMETQFSKVFGTLGNMQQVVNKLQAETPRGMTVELPADVVSEMEKDFPELAAHFRSGLEKALKGIRGTGPASASASPAADPEAVQKLVSTIALRHEVEALEDDHPTWREIVGTVDNEGRHDPNNEFRKWLATQPAAYQQKINAANSARVIGNAIDKYLASKAAPAPKPAPKIAARTDRIRAAIPPRGDGGHQAPANSADDDFRAGFATG